MMNTYTHPKQTIKTILLFILFLSPLSASTSSKENNQSQKSPKHSPTQQKTIQTDISLGSLSGGGMIILVLLTSLLGSLFLKDQFDEIF